VEGFASRKPAGALVTYLLLFKDKTISKITQLQGQEYSSAVLTCNGQLPVLCTTLESFFINTKPKGTQQFIM